MNKQQRRRWTTLKQILCAAVSLVVTVAVQPHADAQTNVEFFEEFSTTGLPGRLFVPDEAANGPRPVIVFLHGAGEVGTDNAGQINGNINNLLSEARERGAFIYAPQANGDWNPRSRTDLVLSMTEQLLANENADPNRVYLTGLSMGGGGAWNLASRYSDRFAANVPIAGITPASDFEFTDAMTVPTWAFHARDDSVVAPNNTRSRISGLVTAAGEAVPTYPLTRGVAPADFGPDFDFTSQNLDLRYTEWRSGGHGIWPRVYSDDAMYDWMFSHSTVPEPSTSALTMLAIAAAFFLRRSK